jgi:hypothetical protein
MWAEWLLYKWREAELRHWRPSSSDCSWGHRTPQSSTPYVLRPEVIRNFTSTQEILRLCSGTALANSAPTELGSADAFPSNRNTKHPKWSSLSAGLCHRLSILIDVTPLSTNSDLQTTPLAFLTWTQPTSVFPSFCIHSPSNLCHPMPWLPVAALNPSSSCPGHGIPGHGLLCEGHEHLSVKVGSGSCALLQTTPPWSSAVSTPPHPAGQVFVSTLCSQDEWWRLSLWSAQWRVTGVQPL